MIVYFLGGLGALLGPLFGVIMADYWLLRRTKINVPELYTEDPTGAYFYRNGFNPRAIAAFIPAAVLSLLIAFIPALHSLSAFSWFFGAGIGAADLLRGGRPQTALRGCVGRADRRRERALTRPLPHLTPTPEGPANAHPRRQRQHHRVHDGLHRRQARRRGARHRDRAADTRFGAESVEGNFESYLAAVAVMETVRSYPEPYDAVIQAGYGEHGREGLQELLDVPVVDITEAAASTAMFLGHKYSVVTTLDRAVPLIEDRLKLAGLDARCASVRASGLAVLELEEDPERAVEAIVDQAEAGRPRGQGRGDRASAAAAWPDWTRAIRERAGVPVVDGVAAAVTIAESLVRLGLTTSKVRTYAPPRPKNFKDWPPR